MMIFFFFLFFFFDWLTFFVCFFSLLISGETGLCMQLETLCLNNAELHLFSDDVDIDMTLKMWCNYIKQ